MPKIRIDLEFQSLIPPLSADEYKQLEENIVADGCRDALVVWEGTLIDGHNRYRICTKNNIPFQTVEKNFKSREDAIYWIITNQFGRRNLSAGDRSILALRLEPIFKEKAKRNQIKGGGAVPQKSAEPVETRKEVAKLAGVSHDTIGKVKKIVDHGTPEQIQRIKKGDKGNTINAVYKEVEEKINPKKQEPTPDEKPQTAKSIKETFLAAVAQLKDNSADTTFTSEQFLLEYQAFAENIIRQFEGYKKEPYSGVYSKLSLEDHKKIAALNTTMLRAVEKINEIQKG